MSEPPKHAVLAFFIGLLAGYWPMRWITISLAWLAGFLCGNAWHLLSRMVDGIPK